MKLTKAQKNALFSIRRQEVLHAYFNKYRASKTVDAVRGDVLEKLLRFGLIYSEGPFQLMFERVTLTGAGHNALNETNTP